MVLLRPSSNTWTKQPPSARRRTIVRRKGPEMGMWVAAPINGFHLRFVGMAIRANDLEIGPCIIAALMQRPNMVHLPCTGQNFPALMTFIVLLGSFPDFFGRRQKLAFGGATTFRHSPVLVFWGRPLTRTRPLERFCGAN